MTFVDIASRNIHMHKIHGGSNKNIESSLLKITPPNAPNMAGQVGGVSGPRNKMLKSDLASNQIQLEQNNISSITSINVGGGKINKNEQTGQGMYKFMQKRSKKYSPLSISYCKLMFLSASLACKVSFK